MIEFGLLIGFWLLCAMVGYGTASLILPRKFLADRLLLMPVIGASVETVLTSFASYCGVPMRRGAVLVCAGGLLLSAAGIWHSRRLRHPRRSVAWVAAVHGLGLFAACAIMTGVWLFHAWNPYTDAFTYVSIADFLQEHSFFTPAVPGAHQPVLSQMLVYQQLGARMGTNFLLAFHTALVRADYSFDVYMPTLALGVWIVTPAFWFMCRRLLMLPRSAAATASVIFSLNPGVSITNPLWGFLPQTYGMAFMFLALTFHIRAAGCRQPALRWLAAGLAVGLVLLTYPEILPFVVLAVLITYAVRVGAGRLGWRDALTALTIPAATACLVAPIAALSFVPMLRRQAGAVVGGDVRFTLFDHLALLTGFRSLMLPTAQRPGLGYGGLRLVVVAGVTTAAYAAFAGPARIRGLTLCLAAPFALGLAWFAIFATNPWNAEEFGQPWSVYKLVTYVFFLFAVLWGVGLTLLWKSRGLLRIAAVLQLAVFCGFFPFASYSIAQQSAAGIQQLTGVKQDPIGEYKRLPAILAALPPDTPVNLVVPPEAQKHRQFVAYFLRRPVIADWSDDGYVWPQLEPGNRRLAIDPAFPMLIYAPSDPKKTVANLVYRPAGTGEVIVTFGLGWNGAEKDDKNWWRWLEQDGQIAVFVPKAGWLAMRGELAVVRASQRTVVLEVVGRPDQVHEFHVPEQWFTQFDFGKFRLAEGTYTLRLRADGPGLRMGPADPRIVRVGVRNLAFSMSPE